MSNPNRVAGQCTVSIGGTRYATAGETTLEIGGPVREAVPGDYEAGAFRETTKEAKADITLLYKAGVSLSALRAMDNETVVLEFDHGSTWIIRSAYCAEAISTGQDGKAKVVFQGPPAEEML